MGAIDWAKVIDARIFGILDDAGFIVETDFIGGSFKSKFVSRISGWGKSGK